ncbi:hypothetical protein IEQ34_003488 [Dendrobium chrysotoxum]|uniref:Uncharacterized protein n=1 Tax=Dendrobium chrysotoxum TaxID=161865 RepID=A0AAV7HMA9_DENCH|nr:hypothetical protein IEQ34_003488 [Dendrobium chrysotoxum]
MKLKEEVMSKRFLLVLHGIRGEKEKRHNSKWENMLASPPCGSLGSKILVTIRMDSVTLMIAKNWRKLWRIPENFRIQGENRLFYRISEWSERLRNKKWFSLHLTKGIDEQDFNALTKIFKTFEKHLFAVHK